MNKFVFAAMSAVTLFVGSAQAEGPIRMGLPILPPTRPTMGMPIMPRPRPVGLPIPPTTPAPIRLGLPVTR